MMVLIACESSGNTREAFRRLGHDAWSCDLLPADDGSPFHYQGDVRDILGFAWDLLIAHPPCTYLSSSGLHWNRRGAMVNGRPRAELTEEALVFARIFIDSPEVAHIPRRAVENPIGCIGTRIRPSDQIIQPYQFGHDASKATCLWLHGLPKLTPTERVDNQWACPCGHRFQFDLGRHGCPNCCGEHGAARPVWGNQTNSGQNKLGPSDDRWKVRSETYRGVAEAFAQQWGCAR